jgi:hypothetical protein
VATMIFNTAWMLWDDLFYVVLAFGIWVIAVWLTFFTDMV